MHTPPACSDVDAVAKDVIAVRDDVAEVYADPVADPPVLGDVRLEAGHTFLYSDRTSDSVHYARELDEHGVSNGLHDSTSVLSDLRINKFTTQSLLPSDGPFLIQTDQPRIANHIGGKDRSESAADLLRHRRTDPRLDQDVSRRRLDNLISGDKLGASRQMAARR